jgi:TRAP-type mannitol/chloroaromatic compound transport system permease small subunit
MLAGAARDIRLAWLQGTDHPRRRILPQMPGALPLQQIPLDRSPIAAYGASIVDANHHGSMNALLSFSEASRRGLERVALVSGWLLVVMAAVTCFDVLARKAGIPAPLTKLQELEWHFHAALFSLWMGYGYTINAHPRVDSFTEKLPYRRKAWMELIGCLLFALPYCALVAYHSIDFVGQSYALAEQSDSTVGLRYRWAIKGIYAFGLWLVVLGILSVLARVIVFLFGNRPPDQVNLQIGHTEADV